MNDTPYKKLSPEWATAPEGLRPRNLVDCWLIAEQMCVPGTVGAAVVRLSLGAWFRLAAGSGMPTQSAAYLAGVGDFKIDPGVISGDSGQCCRFVVTPDGDVDSVEIGARSV